MNRIDAKKRINYELKRTTGGAVNVYDMPDSVTLMNGLDSMENMEEEEANEHAIEVAVEMLENEGFPI